MHRNLIKMKTVTLLKEDFNSPLYSQDSLWEHILAQVGIDSHEKIDGRFVDRGIKSIVISVNKATPL